MQGRFGGWQWLAMAVIMLLPGTLILLPLFSWFLARRGLAATEG